MQDIKGYSTFKKIEPVDKGWSNDKKYYIETADGRKLLLRVADISQFERKKNEFEMMKQVAALGVPMPQPLDFGICCVSHGSDSLCVVWRLRQNT